MTTVAPGLPDDTLPDVVFYHLERQTLEEVLPTLLEKTLERGWRAVVQVGVPARLDAIDDALWTFRDGSFLPHGQARDGHAADQPVFLTDGNETPNGAGVRFLVEGAVPAGYRGFLRLVFMWCGRRGRRSGAVPMESGEIGGMRVHLLAAIRAGAVGEKGVGQHAAALTRGRAIS
jgi:DNA polymerase III subunit chi